MGGSVRRKVLVTGGTGFIGQAVVHAFHALGDDVVVVTRNPGQARLPDGVRVVQGNPMTPGPWQQEAIACDVAVTLAGEHVAGGRWDATRKGHIQSSRIMATRQVVRAFAQEPRPRVLLAGSSTHIYGPRPPSELLADDACAGHTYLAQAMRLWEEAAVPASQVGARVVMLRMGVVLGGGSALDFMVPMAKACLGPMWGAAKFGFPWIHIQDAAGLMVHLAQTPGVSGPANLVAPESATWGSVFAALGRIHRRPVLVPVPRVLARVLVGEAAELWFSGQHVQCGVAGNVGYTFLHPTLEPALRDALRLGPAGVARLGLAAALPGG